MAEKLEFTLSGSSSHTAKLFKYILYNILLQRNVYPDDDFEIERCEGMNHMAISDPEVKQYVETLIQQIDQWAKRQELERVAIALTSVDTLEVIERWTFFVKTKGDAVMTEDTLSEQAGRRQQDFQSQMRRLIVQILNINNILPILDPNNVTFEVYVYTVKGAEEHPRWMRTDDAPIIQGDTEHARLTDIDTADCNVRSFVSYKKPAF
ncbi:DNA-binding protein [Mycotypha africana]|uniref:DNA-binding protein n=1 Tax=Mycotypha africana TaxID=64632 RepID=UPI002300A071|nr:DNA-binding protein [Mycotypha africana]KAI8970371.1 DNA-binding protein [Mycotypha africana]